MKCYTKKMYVINYIHHLLLFVRHGENHHGNGCPSLWASCSGKQALQQCLLQQGVAAVVLQSGKRENSALSATHLQLSSIKNSCTVLFIVHTDGVYIVYTGRAYSKGRHTTSLTFQVVTPATADNITISTELIKSHKRSRQEKQTHETNHIMSQNTLWEDPFSYAHLTFPSSKELVQMLD